MFKIPLRWQAKQVIKYSRISHLYFNIQKEAIKTTWCSCIQINTAQCDCLCMWEGMEIEDEVNQYKKLIEHKKPVIQMHWIYGVLNNDLSPGCDKKYV